MSPRNLKIHAQKVCVVSKTASKYLKPRSRNGTMTSDSGRKRPLKYAIRAGTVVILRTSARDIVLPLLGADATTPIVSSCGGTCCRLSIWRKLHSAHNHPYPRCCAQGKPAR